MIYFLYGQDNYSSKRKLGEIIERHKEIHKSGLNLRFFDGEKLDCRDFQEEFCQTPMFQEKKLLVLKDAFKNQEFKDYFLVQGKNFADSKDIIVFQEEGEIKSTDALFKFLVKTAKTQEFKLLEGAKLRDWAQAEFQKYKTEIRPEALRELLGSAGNDLWRLANEIQKLASFKKEGAVTLKDVNFLVKPRLETDIFQTIEALASRNTKQALSLMRSHLEKGDSPLYLLSMVNFQFRNLLVLKETGRLQGHPYFVRKTAWLAQKFTLEELKKIYRLIFETDLKIKTGQVDPQIALDLLITGI